MRERKLYKSNNRKIAGVCGGIAEFFDIDASVVRLLWALAVMFTGVGVPAYIIAAVVMDDAPSNNGEPQNEEYYESSDSDVIKGFKPEE